jgi:actin related protein 2/3 complex subunit 3
MPVSHFCAFLSLSSVSPISSSNHLQPQAYNSIFNHDSSEPTTALVGNFPLLPLRTRVRGPAYTLPLDASLPLHLSPEPDSESYDALDEVLSLFRANTFFRNFEIQGPADRLLIYGILWVSECLGKIRPNMSARYVESMKRACSRADDGENE